MSLLDGDIKVSDLEGNLYYLVMPVERVFEIKFHYNVRKQSFKEQCREILCKQASNHKYQRRIPINSDFI